MAEGKLAVILGGGNGIGAATARLMKSRGWRVAVADLSLPDAQKLANELDSPAYGIDVSDLQGVEALASEIEEHHGPVQSLVVCAAMFQERYAPDAFPMDVFSKILRVNIEGTFFANRVFGTRMAKRGSGSIVNVASVNGLKSSPTHAYGPSKAAVINITRNLAGQWGRSGVRVNSVSPGATLVARVLARPPGRYSADIENQLALGRRIQPEEVAEGIEFLASDRASAITGIDLPIDAGSLTASGWTLYGGVPPSIAEVG
ncbi:SDR family NAD(P)-dependent oxidoreductase [Ottowia thiooxydans]|uniref:SDR family NAD(P)-dependent oxidoreductase n=1 Tax=Ottowia thiooxydans TaxID=219182 RepID=UPI000429D21A|nr:SDR family oxidoreductase [Ottowia thiooxydans]